MPAWSLKGLFSPSWFEETEGHIDFDKNLREAHHGEGCGKVPRENVGKYRTNKQGSESGPKNWADAMLTNHNNRSKLNHFFDSFLESSLESSVSSAAFTSAFEASFSAFFRREVSRACVKESP